MATYGNHVGSTECHQGSNTALLRNCASSNGTASYHLVGGIPTPLKNMSSSVGIIIIPNIWKNREKKNTNQSSLGIKWAFENGP